MADSRIPLNRNQSNDSLPQAPGGGGSGGPAPYNYQPSMGRQMNAPLPNAATYAHNGGRPLPPSSAGRTRNEFTTNSFAHEATDINHDGFAAGFYGSIMSAIGTCIGVFGSIPICCCCPNPYIVVPQGNVGLFSRFGRYARTVDPGLQYVNLMTEKMVLVDVKLNTGDIPRQVAITKDNVTVSIDSVLYWGITEPYTATYKVSDVRMALIERTMTTLRQVVGSHDLQDIISNREGIAHEIQNIIEPPASAWGVHIESILIKDIQFSAELQENLSAAAKQRRLGAAKIIAAQAEVESARLMREASDILNTPAAMQIRYLETLKSMAHENNSKIIFMPPSFNEGVGGPLPPAPLSKNYDQKKGAHPDTFGMTHAAVMDTITNL